MWSNIYKPIYIYTYVYIYNTQNILSLDHGWIWVNNLSRPFCQVPEWMWTTGTAVPCRPARPMRHVGDGPLKASTTSRRRGCGLGYPLGWVKWWIWCTYFGDLAMKISSLYIILYIYISIYIYIYLYIYICISIYIYICISIYIYMCVSLCVCVTACSHTKATHVSPGLRKLPLRLRLRRLQRLLGGFVATDAFFLRGLYYKSWSYDG